MLFLELQELCGWLAKSYASDILRLLRLYESISASEAASRLGLHIKTAQDILDGFARADFVSKLEIFQGKRPYYRYFLVHKRVQFGFDTDVLFDKQKLAKLQDSKFRERKNSGAIFTTAPKEDRIVSFTSVTGSGRHKQQRKFLLTKAQGRFLFFLPFPTETPLFVKDICVKAGIEEKHFEETLDIVDVLLSERIVISEDEPI